MAAPSSIASSKSALGFHVSAHRQKMVARVEDNGHLQLMVARLDRQPPGSVVRLESLDLPATRHLDRANDPQGLDHRGAGASRLGQLHRFPDAAHGVVGLARHVGIIPGDGVRVRKLRARRKTFEDVDRRVHGMAGESICGSIGANPERHPAQLDKVVALASEIARAPAQVDGSLPQREHLERVVELHSLVRPCRDEDGQHAGGRRLGMVDCPGQVRCGRTMRAPPRRLASREWRVSEDRGRIRRRVRVVGEPRGLDAAGQLQLFHDPAVQPPPSARRDGPFNSEAGQFVAERDTLQAHHEHPVFHARVQGVPAAP